MAEYLPDADLDPIYRAYVYSARVHQGQLRTSGEPYLNHPLWVAYILTQLNADVATVAAGLLHDTVEDTWATLDDLAETFGPDIAGLVDGVTKLGKLNYVSKAQENAENFRKMFVAMASDLRVILIKLADRLHNMRTLDVLREAKQREIANETLELYAPLAGRLGMQWIKSELEDLSLRYIDPQAFAELGQQVALRQREGEAYVASVVTDLKQLLTDAAIPADVSGRPKHLYSVYRKLQQRDVTIDQIFDLIAFRVLVPDLPRCYAALGLVHNRWKPIPGRFKDYIAMPKANRYQSLHTTVIGPEGRPMEIQIRTHEMHLVAELGVAAHWDYKEGGHASEREREAFAWLRQFTDWQRDLKDPEQFVEAVRIELFQDEVYVFTPSGEVVDLPSGATALDFAYKIHTEVGNHATGAKVNGRMVQLDQALTTGDIVEILTSPHQYPRPRWLRMVQTTRARQKIKAFLNRQDRDRAMALGRALLSQALREAGEDHDLKSWSGTPAGKETLKQLGFADTDTLIAALGYGKLAAKRLQEALSPSRAEPKSESRLLPAIGRLWRRDVPRDAIVVDGLNDVETGLARCCRPLPGEAIRGYIRPGKGIRVHRADCPHLSAANPDRLVDVAWGGAAGTARQRVTLRVDTVDAPGLLAKVGKAIADLGINIVETNIRTIDGGRATGTLGVAVASRGELNKVTRALKRVKGVTAVEELRD